MGSLQQLILRLLHYCLLPSSASPCSAWTSSSSIAKSSFVSSRSKGYSHGHSRRYRHACCRAALRRHCPRLGGSHANSMPFLRSGVPFGRPTRMHPKVRGKRSIHIQLRRPRLPAASEGQLQRAFGPLNTLAGSLERMGETLRTVAYTCVWPDPSW